MSVYYTVIITCDKCRASQFDVVTHLTSRQGIGHAIKFMRSTLLNKYGWIKKHVNATIHDYCKECRAAESNTK